MAEKYLKPADVAEILGISLTMAREIMPKMAGCINVGRGRCNQSLRVPASGLHAWTDNRVICMPKGKIARRPIGRRREKSG